MDKIIDKKIETEIHKTINNGQLIRVSCNEGVFLCDLYDIVDTDVRKNGHQFGVAIYQDLGDKITFEVDVLMYKDEIVSIYKQTIRKSINY